MWRAYISIRGRTTNKSTKLQISKVAWLTVLTGCFNKPSSRLLKLSNKNLEKITILGLSKILAFSQLRKIQRSLNLRNF